MTDANTDWQQPFDYGPFLSIDSNGGNIGRIYWTNQMRFVRGGRHYTFPPRPRGWETYEVPGSCRLIGTLGQWRSWILHA